MAKVFLDTSFYIAYLRPRDIHHSRAVALLQDLLEEGQTLVTSQFVLMEAGGGLRSPGLRNHFVKFVQELMDSRCLETVVASELLFDETWSLYAARSDKEWSMVDCSSFVIMDKMGIEEALAADHHFKQKGYRTLLT